jgi:hypothetical protein
MTCDIASRISFQNYFRDRKFDWLFKVRFRKDNLEFWDWLLDKIEVHRTETCKVDRSILSIDAYPKGYRDVIIQNISIKPVNTNYMIEIFYSPSDHKTYSGKLPDCIKGEFGPGIKSLIITLNHVANVSEPKIHEFLKNIGVHISKYPQRNNLCNL